MTDNEIKKACKNCIHYTTCIFCNGGGCTAKDCGDYIEANLINRLQAEVKRLENHLAMSKKEIKKCVTHYKMACTERNEFLEQLKTAKAEAYKECIEKVKEEINKHSYGVLHKTVINYKLDNLLKELVGDK